MPYIEKEKAVEAIRKYADVKHSNGEPIEYVNGILKSISVINEQPTSDVEQVIRCGQCEYWKLNPHNLYGGYCRHCEGASIDHYCSYGKKKQ